ncbi:MAG: transglutaminase-like domain-containing protein [Cyclobacteriaceae bacterium]|jgi:transglutaminase-like putative cysteine protease
MSSNLRHRFSQLLFRLLLVVVPTAVIGYITLRWLNLSFTSLNTNLLGQTAYFAAGLAIAYGLYFFRARALVTLLLLGIAYYFVDQAVSRLPGEFDVFYATTRFQLFSTLFLVGWLFGFLLSRFTWGYIVVSALLVVVTLVTISDTTDLSYTYLLTRLLPLLLYALYLFFLTPQLSSSVEWTLKKAGRLSLRLLVFVLLVLLSFLLTERLLRGQLQAVEKELAARGAQNEKDNSQGGHDNRHGLMENTDDGLRLKDTIRVTSRMSQSDKLMFCARLNNYEGEEPIPLYFVFHYLTRYDPVKETFTRDVNVPSLDEIDVDPADVPLYYSFTDTSIFRKAMGDRYRKVVEANVYLSENTWKHSVLGPSSVFAIQTIPVEKDFQKTFLSAYKIYTYTSELNNAYFVYNVSANPFLETVQEQRHEELRTVRNYARVNREFLNYYTQVPSGGIYDSIAQLAKSLVPANARPLDKVLAVRDFFLQRDEFGKRIFRYTLKPGAVDDPNIPSSRMLYDFIFKTKAGYCTYYAGASHFMLRSLGIPTRFTTGFATIDRSDKNKGWYWFYASQAHAWTQVYFPEYGWMDFDMTIGNEEQQEAPKPDGTPPLPPPEPWLVLNAVAGDVNSARKNLSATFRQVIFHNTPHELEDALTLNIDASLCRIVFNERDTTFAAVQPGDSVIVVSYKDEAKKIPAPRAGVPIDEQIKKFAQPVPADEIHIHRKEEKKDNTAAGSGKKPARSIDWWAVARVAAYIALAVVVLLVLSPALYLVYLLLRVRLSHGTAQTDWIYRATLYRLHMAGIFRENETPLHYAQHKVDPVLRISFAAFMNTYLRMKYSARPVDAQELAEQKIFHRQVGPAVRQHAGVVRALLNYFRLWRAYLYVQQPTESETTSL